MAPAAVRGRAVSLTIVFGVLSGVSTAAAGDAQWLANPGSGNFTDAANWTGGAVPTGTATFAASAQTNVTIAPGGPLLMLDGITLAPDAGAYNFSIPSGNVTLRTTGVVVNGGSATFDLTGSGLLSFRDGSAGSASYVIGSGSPGLLFYNTSSAGTATITNNGGASGWRDSSTAGNATIINNSGTISWVNSSTAGDATVIVNGGTIIFAHNATAGNAQLVANAGLVDFSFTTGPLGDHGITAGSIEGTGHFALGAAQLSVGGNNRDTTVSGVIGDCGPSDGCINPSTGGSLVKVGTGTLTLTGSNTYTGGTTIAGGTLAVSSDASLGAAAGDLTLGGGTLRFLNGFTTARWVRLDAGGGTFDTNGNDVTLAGAIGGNGALIKVGAGTLTLTNENGYRGGTFINAGTVAIRSNVNLGMGSGPLGGAVVFNGGTLQFLQGISTSRAMIFNAAGGTIDTMGNTGVLRGVLRGDGGLTKAGSGTLVLQGASTYGGPTSVNAGVLVGGDANTLSSASAFTVASGARLDIGGYDQTIGSLAGAGTVMNSGEPAATLTVGGNDASTIFSGVIADGLAPLALVKTGAGTLVLNGQNTFTGPTTIQAGKLVVGDDSHPAASLASTVTVGAGVLGGIGTVGGVVVGAGGHVAPGNSIGTLNVAGNVGFAAGSAYDVEINAAGQSDRIVAGGKASLSGGDVNVSAPAGFYRTGMRYTILTANGGVTGAFSTLNQSFPFLTLALNYDPNNVYLDVLRGQATFPSVAVTRNQVASAAAIEKLGAGTTLYDAVVQQPSAASARQAFDLLSGEALASAKSVMIEDSRFVREAALDRLRAAFDGVGAARSPVMAYASSDPGLPPATERFALWAHGFGVWGSASGNGNAAGLSRDIGGLFAGGDAAVADTWRLGVLGGYSHSTFRVGDRSSSGASDNYHVGLYGGTQWGSLAFRSGAAFTWHDIATSRSVNVPGFADMTRGSQQARTAQVFGELGYRIDAGRRTAFEPFANLAYVNLSTDGFSERGGAAALAVRGDSTAVTVTTLGLRAEHGFSFFDGPRMTARGSLGWRHAYGDIRPSVTVAFAGGSPFGIAGLPFGRDAAVAGAGLDINLTDQAVIGIAYDGQFGPRLSDQSLKGQFSVRF